MKTSSFFFLILISLVVGFAMMKLQRRKATTALAHDELEAPSKRPLSHVPRRLSSAPLDGEVIADIMPNLNSSPAATSTPEARPMAQVARPTPRRLVITSNVPGETDRFRKALGSEGGAREMMKDLEKCVDSIEKTSTPMAKMLCKMGAQTLARRYPALKGDLDRINKK